MTTLHFTLYASIAVRLMRVFDDLRFLTHLPHVAVLLLIAGAWGPMNTAHAQHPTEVTSILNSNQDTTLESNHSGSLLVPGKFGELDNYDAPKDSIPAEGPGTRLMWYPAKAAFRAGRLYDNTANLGEDGRRFWDAAEIGKYSIAMGRNTKASGRAAVALGSGSKATNISATAFSGAVASGVTATAMGLGSEAEGSSATAMGQQTVADTDYSLSAGTCNNKNRGNDDSNSRTGPLFVVGNGQPITFSCDTRSDALVLDQSGNLTTAGTVNGSSDRRLKKNIQSLSDDIMKRLSDLRPVRYEFKNQETHPSGEQIGLLAQDVQKEFPQFVTKGTDGYLSLAYPRLTAVLVKGLQEQQAQLEVKQSQIKNLKAENEQIKQQQAKLKKRLAALEAKVSADDPALASLAGPWSLALLLGLGLGGLGAGLLYRRRA